MRKIVLVLFVTVLWVLFYSCTKDKAAKPQPVSCAGISPDSNTYNLKIKAIVDFNCAYTGCHDHASAGRSRNVDLEGYTAAKNSFQTDSVFCAINYRQGCLTMPQGLPKLADSLISYMQCWADNGYPE